MKDKTLMQNEEGSVIVLALVLLVLLTILGISATRTSTIEVQIASNERQAVHLGICAHSECVSYQWLRDGHASVH